MTLNDIAHALKQIPFRPHPVLPNGHAQTIISSLLPRRVNLLKQFSKPRYFNTAPNVRILAHCSWQGDKAARPCLLMVHGFEGSTESPYMLGTAEKALQAGLNVVRINLRNCGGGEIHPTFYNAGLTTDIRSVVRELTELDGVRDLFIVGFSLGGNQTLKFAGEEGTGIPETVRAVAAVSPSIDLPACIDALERPSNIIYHTRFVNSIKRSLRRKAALYPSFVDASPLERIRTLRKFDELYTAPYSGYRGSGDYYVRASSLPYIRSIAVPTLIIHAKDDPFIPHAPLEREEIGRNPNVIRLTTERGGHVGFLSENDGHEQRWAEARIVQFLKGVMSDE